MVGEKCPVDVNPRGIIPFSPADPAVTGTFPLLVMLMGVWFAHFRIVQNIDVPKGT